MTKSKKRNNLKSAGIGAVVGAVFSVYGIFASTGMQSQPMGYYVGQILGGLVGGAFLFAIVSAVRNLFVK